MVGGLHVLTFADRVFWQTTFVPVKKKFSDSAGPLPFAEAPVTSTSRIFPSGLREPQNIRTV